MGGEVTFSAFLLEEFGKFVAGVFTTTVGAKSLDLNSVLSECPSCKDLVRLESFILGAQDVNDCVSGGIVCKSDVIATSTKRIDQGWSPEVSVNLITKTFGRQSLSLLENDFASHLCVFA